MENNKMFFMNIIFKDGDEFEMSEKHLKPIFSNNIDELEKIKNVLTSLFSKKNKNKKKNLYIYINEVDTNNKDVTFNVKKDMKNFFNF